jgi:bacteriocin-like protein
MNKKELQNVKGGAELYGAMLELDSTKGILQNHLDDLKLEISSSRKALRGVDKRYKMGAELYKKIYGKDINLMKGKLKNG